VLLGLHCALSLQQLRVLQGRGYGDEQLIMHIRAIDHMHINTIDKRPFCCMEREFICLFISLLVWVITGEGLWIDAWSTFLATHQPSTQLRTDLNVYDKSPFIYRGTAYRC